jgi:phage terminase small subunit
MTKPRHRRRKYSSEPLATVPPESELGPKMLALTPKQRAFVMELRHGPAGYGSEVRAARAAGYGRPTSTDNALKVTAHQVLHNPRVQEALCEVGAKIIRAEAFQSIKTTAAIARDMRHKDCLRANLALMDRSFPVETHHHVTVERRPEMIVVATAEVVERIRQLALKAGLDPIKQIEATASPVVNMETTP